MLQHGLRLRKGLLFICNQLPIFYLNVIFSSLCSVCTAPQVSSCDLHYPLMTSAGQEAVTKLFTLPKLQLCAQMEKLLHNLRIS